MDSTPLTPCCPPCPGQCIPLASLCDGVPDCGRGEDELPAHCIALGPAADLGQNPLLVPDTAEAGYVKVGHWDT